MPIVKEAKDVFDDAVTLHRIQTLHFVIAEFNYQFTVHAGKNSQASIAVIRFYKLSTLKHHVAGTRVENTIYRFAIIIFMRSVY